MPHGVEVVYFLDTLDKSHAKRNREYARKVSSYVFEFDRTGESAFSGGPARQDHKLLRDWTLVFGSK